MKKLLFYLSIVFVFSSSSLALAAPTITQVEVASTPSSTSTSGEAYYGDGETITFRLTFSEAVTITGGSPELSFSVANGTERSVYSGSGTSSTTAEFDYTVDHGTETVSDWNGGISASSLIKSGSTIQNAAGEDLDDTIPSNSFDFLIDSGAPEYGSAEITSDDGVVDGGTRYLKSGDKFTFTLSLENSTTDTSSSDGYFTVKISNDEENINFGNAESGSKSDFSKTSTVSFLEGKDGTLSISAVHFLDAAGNALTRVPSLIPSDITVDNTAPSLRFGNDVSATWTDRESIQISASDMYLDHDSLVYGFSADNVCDSSDTFSNTFSTGSTFEIATEAENGKYLCAKASDIVGNTTYAISANALQVDIAAPELVFTDDTSASWVSSETIVLSATDSYLDTSSLSYGFSVDSTCDHHDAYPNTFTNDSAFVLATEVENGKYVCAKALDLAGNTTYAISSNPLQIDITPPTISDVTIYSNNPDPTLARTNDTITLEFTADDNLSSAMFLQSDSSHILGFPINRDEVSGFMGSVKASRFTTGEETSEAVVYFALQITDEAGNSSNLITSTNDSSTVAFDQIVPQVQNVHLKAESADGSAFLGDACTDWDGLSTTCTTERSSYPQYYAKAGDSITLQLEACDYVDTDAEAPKGTLGSVSVTLDDQGLTGETCTTAGGHSGEWRTWEIQETISSSWDEGLLVFDIIVTDNAGNGSADESLLDEDGNSVAGALANYELQVTATTNNSRVVVDHTAPTIPTMVQDAQGAETDRLKHRSNAVFTWSGETDPTPSSGGQTAGIWEYYWQLENDYNGGEIHRAENLISLYQNDGTQNTDLSWDATISELSPWIGEPIPARELNFPYQVYSVVVDKAGNASQGTRANLSWNDLVYEQGYSVGLLGTVTNASGNPLKNATVKVVARYSEECQTNTEICQAVTDEDGKYSVVLQTKPTTEQDYNVTVYHPSYFLAKEDFFMDPGDNADDVLIDFPLQLVDARTLQQTFDQTIAVVGSTVFSRGKTKTKLNELAVETLSGEISLTTQSDGSYLLSSLSRITGVRLADSLTASSTTVSNGGLTTEYIGPEGNAVTITDNQDNTWTVEGLGEISRYSSVSNTKNTHDNQSYLVYKLTTSDTFSSGESRLGVVRIPAQPLNHYERRAGDPDQAPVFKNPQESIAHAKKINEGIRYQILFDYATDGSIRYLKSQPGRLSVEKQLSVRPIPQQYMRGRGVTGARLGKVSPQELQRWVAPSDPPTAERITIDRQNASRPIRGLRTIRPQQSGALLAVQREQITSRTPQVIAEVDTEYNFYGQSAERR